MSDWTIWPCRVILLHVLYFSSYVENADSKRSPHSSVGRASAWSHTVRYWHHRSQSLAPPVPASRYVEENGSAAILATKRLAGVTPEVNLLEYMCNTYTSTKCENKTAHSNFETQRRHHHKSKTEVSVVPQKDLCPPKKFFFKCANSGKPRMEYIWEGKEQPGFENWFRKVL